MASKRAKSPTAASPSARRAATKTLASSPTSNARASSAAPSLQIPGPVIANKSGLPQEILARTPRQEVPPGWKVWKVPHMPHVWIAVWFVINILVVLWDAMYVLGRPGTMYNTPLASKWAWIWAPYETYGAVDKLYGMQGYLDASQGKDHWNAAQSILNLVEIVGGILFLLAFNWNDARANPLGIVVSTATAYKTITYFLLEHLSGWVYTGHNGAVDFWLLYILPSSVWIVLPMLVILDLSGQSVEKLDPST